MQKAPFFVLAITSAIISSPICFAATESNGELIKIDGSSTVYPITEAVAEDFGATNGAVKVTVGISGTGGGFKKFCVGETDISDASRPIKSAEIETCKANNVEYIELPVAYDALTVVINPKNTWAKSITTAELKRLWEPEAQGKIKYWNQIRDTWPHEPIALFGPGTDSGTFDYFTEAIVGKQGASRGDYTSSEDDNVIVKGIMNDKNALGYFGLSYYHENASKITAVAIDDNNETNGKGAILPSVDTVQNGTYQPLGRPLFIYVNKAALSKTATKQFVDYYVANAAKLSAETGYVQLPKEGYELTAKRLHSNTTGSMFASGSNHVGLTIVQLMQQEK